MIANEKEEEIGIENVIRIVLNDSVRKELIQGTDKVGINNHHSGLSFLLDLLM